jgi:aspartate kinase
MAEGEIAVIPGFQGVSSDNRVTTLGRGGSDTSAVAVAAAIKADRCDIYTDVDGVYTTDPRIVAKARKLDRVTYEEMLELASVGSKVLQTRSVSLAMKEGVRVQVLSSFIDENAVPADDLPGTMIVSDEELEGIDMERQLITGIAADKNEAKVTLTRIADRPGAVSRDLRPARRRQHQRRHDHPERRQGQGRDRRDLHGAAGRPRARHRRCWKSARKRSAITA